MLQVLDQATVSGGLLRIGRVGAQSVVLNARMGDPLKLLMPRGTREAAWVYTSTYGGGLLSGDQLRLQIDLEAGAAAFLGTQASTKIYKQGSTGAAAEQIIDVTCDSDSVLVSLPDPVQCFRNARFIQSQSFHCARDASLLALDCYSAGRIARDERWVFDSLSSRMQVYREGRCCFDDPLHLESHPLLPSLAERMQQYNYFGSALIIGPALNGLRAQLQQRIAACSAAGDAELIESLSPVADDFFVWRFAAVDGDRLQSLIYQHVDVCVGLMGGSPWRRRA